jgi:hypothetical protein
MTFDLIPSDDRQYIIIKARGDTTNAAALERIRAAWKLGSEIGIRCFLVDLTESRNVEPVIKHVHLAKDEAPRLVPREVRWAVLTEPSDHSHDFQVALTLSQGNDMVQFWDREEAIAYLLEAAPYLNTQPADTHQLDSTELGSD